MPYDLLIAGGTLIDPAQNTHAPADIAFKDNRVAAVGASLDRADRMYAERTAQDSLEYNQVGQGKSWRNPDSGNSGTFTPTRTYKTASGQNCRQFETTIYVDGKQETGTGRACRQADGTWQIIR